MAPKPTVGGKGTHGGYCGPAVKPIALNMVAEIARDPATRGLPISGIGGISDWRDAAEFMVARQLDRPGLHGGDALRIQDRERHDRRPPQLDGRERLSPARGLHRQSHPERRRTGTSSTSTTRRSPRSIKRAASSAGFATSPARTLRTRRYPRNASRGAAKYEVIEKECVGCNLCSLACPVDCIAMVERPSGKPYLPWTRHPNNPMRVGT